MKQCLYCATQDELMTYSTRKYSDDTIRKTYICRPCRREKYIRDHEVLSVHKSQGTSKFDFEAASKASIERLSQRPFYVK